MKIFDEADALRRYLARVRHERIALVPTMGCLHEGHLSLIRKARRLADIVVVSIYVNPLQFAPDEDLARYPRPFEQDVQRCREEGVHAVFHPHDLYDGGHPKVTLQISDLADSLCGQSRPGHFDGVATVVNILFNIVQPDLAVFGEKDWQQLTIIQRMVADFHMPVEIASAPIVRENDGLAMSSRNRYLSAQERQQAVALPKALRCMLTCYQQGMREASRLCHEGEGVLTTHGLKAEYLELRHAHTLQLLSQASEESRIFLAVPVGAARLIDNIAVTESFLCN